MKKFFAKKKITKLTFTVVLTLNFGMNINATVEASISETSLQKEARDNSLKAQSLASLSIPTEDKYDVVKDIKNTSGIMIERKFYLKGKLVERRTYTTAGSTDCRMRNKYLYYSNGSTVYAHRTYHNIGTVCYNLETKKYNTSAKLQTHLIYENKVNGKVKKRIDWDKTGTYYTQVGYYKNGVIISRDYFKGSSKNYVTHRGKFNKTGKNWTKVTYYYNEAKDIKEVVKYRGSEPNYRKNATGYRTDGTKKWDKEYDAKGVVSRTIGYDAKGLLVVSEAEIYLDKQVRIGKITYQDNKIDRKYVTYRDKAGLVTRTLNYYDNGNHGIKWETLYKKDGSKVRAKHYEKDTGKLLTEITYQGKDNIDIVTFYNTENGQIIRKLRYFQDGKHLRWNINYINGQKESVKLYDNENDYEYKETYQYTATDKELENNLKIIHDRVAAEIEDNVTYSSIFNNEAFARYIENKIELVPDSIFYLEDVKIVEDISIENANEIAGAYAVEASSDEAFGELDEIENKANDQIEHQETGNDSINNENVQAELTTTYFDTIDGIGYLTELKTVQIHNGFVGTIPHEIRNLKKLKKLDLSNNHIAGVSINLNNLKSLEEINLSNNNLTTTDKYFTNLTNLKKLDLRNNPNILFISNDLINLNKNHKLEDVEISSNVNYKDSDITNYDEFYNLDKFNVIDDKLKIDNTLVTKIYKDDRKLNYIDTIIPYFTNNVIKDLNSKKIGEGNIDICYLSDNPEYEIDATNNDETLNKEKLTCQSEKKLDIKEEIDNSNFSKAGTYVVFINAKNKKLDIKHSVIVKKYDTTVEQEIASLNNGKIENVDPEFNEEPTVELNDNEDTLASQIAQEKAEKEGEALSQLEYLESQYNVAKMDGYAGAYLNKENEIVVQFSNDNINKLIETSRIFKCSKLKFKRVDKSIVDLNKLSDKIIKQNSNMNINIAVDSQGNRLNITVARKDYNELLNKLSLVSNLSSSDYTIEQVNEMANVLPTAVRNVKMGTAYRYAGIKDTFATFGFRVKKKKYYCVKKKNGKCKRKNNGKMVYKSKWIYGATVPHHDNRAKNTKYYSNNKYVGYKYARSSLNDTDMVAFNTTKYARPIKEVYGYGRYSSASSTNNKIIVEGATVWKVYRSLYSNRKLVRGTITNTSISVQGCDSNGGHCIKTTDNIQAKIPNIHGDSGGPLLLKYNDKSYIIGTSHSGITVKGARDYSGPYAYFNKTSKSLAALKAVAY